MAKANQKATPKKSFTDEEIEELLKKGWKSLNNAFDELIKGCEMQQMDLVVEALTLTKKIAKIYENAHLAQFYSSRGATENAE
ncbi:MAG: hypothetical protein R6U65_07290 [Perlabentimonas sp.]